MTACHYTPEQIDNMYMIDVLDLVEYWKEWPPEHEILMMVHRDPDKTEKNSEKENKYKFSENKTGSFFDTIKQPVFVDDNDPSGLGKLLGGAKSKSFTFNDLAMFK